MTNTGIGNTSLVVKYRPIVQDPDTSRPSITFFTQLVLRPASGSLVPKSLRADLRPWPVFRVTPVWIIGHHRRRDVPEER